jgi:hypothetical protein
VMNFTTGCFAFDKLFVQFTTVVRFFYWPAAPTKNANLYMSTHLQDLEGTNRKR